MLAYITNDGRHCVSYDAPRKQWCGTLGGISEDPNNSSAIILGRVKSEAELESEKEHLIMTAMEERRRMSVLRIDLICTVIVMQPP